MLQEEVRATAEQLNTNRAAAQFLLLNIAAFLFGLRLSGHVTTSTKHIFKRLNNLSECAYLLVLTVFFFTFGCCILLRIYLTGSL
jgi:hypothetical protein